MTLVTDQENIGALCHAATRILLVADLSADALRQLLTGCGSFEWSQIHSVADVLESPRRAPCDLVLLDISLAACDGAEAFAGMRAACPGIPIIVLHAADDEALALRLIQAGAQECLDKARLDGPALARAMRYAMARQRSQEAMTRERQLLHTLLDHLPDRIYFKDQASRFILINRAMAELFHLDDPRDAVGKTDFDFFDREHAQQAFDDERQIMRTGAALLGRIEREYLPDGRIDWVSSTKAPLHDAEGRIVGTFGVSRDISDLKGMEDALEYERNLLRSLINSLPDHIYVKDLQHRFLIANTALQQFFGVSSTAEIIGKSDFDFFSRDTAAYFNAEETHILRSGHAIVNREAGVHGSNGESRWVLTTKVPLRDSDDRVIGVVGVNRDVTERKEHQEQLKRSNVALEAREKDLLTAVADLKRSHEQMREIQLQLVQVEKMESIGRLAAGVAHEVKNPLAILSMGLDYLSAQSTLDTATVPPVINSMKNAVRRADAVIRGLLDYSAPKTLTATIEDLNAVIEQALLLVRHEIVRTRIACRKELTPALPGLFIDANKIEQVFINLFMNAIHAMPKGGTLTVRTRVADPAGPRNNSSDRMADRLLRGERIVIAEVEDTGEGIPEDKLHKVFDPFFTTKPTGKGTGLGLTVTKAIVELHGGTIEITNRPEGGVKVTLSFKAEGEPAHERSQTHSDRGR